MATPDQGFDPITDSVRDQTIATLAFYLAQQIAATGPKKWTSALDILELAEAIGANSHIAAPFAELVLRATRGEKLAEVAEPHLWQNVAPVRRDSATLYDRNPQR